VTTKVLLDTDIGSDIDDAVCLAYLLAHPRCEILGITTVTGEPVKRAMMASALCMQAGVDVPIVPGFADPIRIEQAQRTAPQAEALARWPHDRGFPEVGVCDFLAGKIRANPGEVTLLAIGPLTNIGVLFRENPDLPSLLEGMVMMCGDYVEGIPRTEWNSGGDPDATKIVFDSRVRPTRAVGLNVTRLVTMGSGEVRRKFRTRLLEPVLDFAEIWFKGTDTITFHDPLAAATIFDDSICEFGGGRVAVRMDEDGSSGTTMWQPRGEEPPHEVALSVNPDRFFEHLFGVIR
jgi:inosine-uridine nucleoside N-ribohydrolase